MLQTGDLSHPITEHAHGASPFRTSWFEVAKMEAGVYMISEPGHVNSWLVEGEKDALLFDTGLGIANIRKVAEEITPRRLMVVNSHYHFDHTGGNHLFDEFAIHRLGADLVSKPSPPEIAELYMAYTQRLLEAWGPYREADELYFHILTAERMIRPLPDGFDPATYKIVPTVPTRLLEDGDVLDLGGRKLQVLHTPGHSPDCICLFDEANGLLFGGDTINTGPIYAQYEESDLEKFAKSTERLADMADGYRRVFVCHYLRYDEPSALVREVAAGFKTVLAGDAFIRDNVDCYNYPVNEACFEHFSIFIGPRG
jgi:glyoxylase-like metal-dependent hydrolase (beta-lactamase superfamily II)